MYENFYTSDHVVDRHNFTIGFQSIIQSTLYTFLSLFVVVEGHNKSMCVFNQH